MTSLLIPAQQLLTSAEEIDLAVAMEAGVFADEILQGHRLFAGATSAELHEIRAEGRRARERYVLANVRLVMMVAQRAAWASGLSVFDLFQEGMTGLITAVDRFDHRHGVRFATYALPWIRAQIARVVANRCGAIAVSDFQAARRRTVRTAWFRLTEDFGRSATPAEVAVATGIALTAVAELLVLDPPLALIDDGGVLVDPPDPRADRALDEVLIRRPAIAEWVRRLPQLEQRVVALRFGFEGEPRSYAVIAECLRLSKTSVRRVEARALERLRTWCPTAALAAAG